MRVPISLVSGWLQHCRAAGLFVDPVNGPCIAGWCSGHAFFSSSRVSKCTLCYCKLQVYSALPNW